MPRDLTAEERALWRRATADLRGEVQTLVGAPTLPNVAALRPSAPTAPKLPRRTTIESSLDGGWDRKLKAGSVVPDRIVDLHGLSVDRAHARAVDALASAVHGGERVLLIVTGKPPPKGSSRLDDPLRGIIRASIGDWFAATPFARSIAAVRSAHPRHGGVGALYVILRRGP